MCWVFGGFELDFDVDLDLEDLDGGLEDLGRGLEWDLEVDRCPNR